jgi:beta-glucosidase
MPWIDDVSAVLWMGYLGNETGNALASILLGNESPSGRLSLTFPRRNEDVPAFLDYKSEKGKVHYTEGLHVGWKWYDARKIAPLFPFGHVSSTSSACQELSPEQGLNYTQFEYTDLKTKSVALKDVSDFSADFEVTVRNVGKRSSAHTVLLFLSPPAPTDLAALSHPPSALAAFARTPMLEPGASHLTHLKIDKYAISHWDDYTLDGGCWSALNGEWEVWLGNPGAVKLRATFAVQLSGSSQWRGI